MTEPRSYFSVRTGRANVAKVSLEMLYRLVREIYFDFDRRAYFEELWGKDCHDNPTYGIAGHDPGAYVFRKLRKAHVWPLKDWQDARPSEDDVFDLIEFLYDHVSRPVAGWNHAFNDCGMHWEEFDRDAGRAEFRNEVNEVLRDYGSGWVLSTDGEIVQIPPTGLERLLDAELPEVGGGTVGERVAAARRKFLARSAAPSDRRDAIRDLADVLEYLRQDVKAVLTSADERDLFNLVNNFGIRHHNPTQRTAYDLDIWFSWMFYHYLATIHAVTRLIERKHGPQR